MHIFDSFLNLMFHQCSTEYLYSLCLYLRQSTRWVLAPLHMIWEIVYDIWSLSCMCVRAKRQSHNNNNNNNGKNFNFKTRLNTKIIHSSYDKYLPKLLEKKKIIRISVHAKLIFFIVVWHFQFLSFYLSRDHRLTIQIQCDNSFSE